MKAIAYQLNNDGKLGQFVELEQTMPTPEPHDLLVKIAAISVNPVDYKVRQRITDPQQAPKILGWDAAGIVEAVGDSVSLFKPGDQVFYAGDITRSGSNATYQLVDERIVGHMPQSLDFSAAAALPLTAITAWEALFERLKIDPEHDREKKILMIGAAGGVGSIAIQLAKQVAGLTVIATASRQESEQWCQSMGADYVINHHQDLAAQFQQLNLAPPDYILCLNNTDAYFNVMAELIAPQGMICSIVETTQEHNIDALKSKSAGFVWEFMFTRSMFKTADMIRQHELLNAIAELIDAGKIKTTLNTPYGKLSTESIMAVHRQLETGSCIGKIVLVN